MIIWNVFSFILGAIVGSFLNVCIFRIPEGESIVKPLSRCPQCKNPIRFYDNIPIISFLILKGKCRDCGQKISWQYPIVELITGILCLFLYREFGFSLMFLIFFFFTCVLIVIAFIDLNHQIIPDILTLPGIPIFFLLAVFVIKVPWLEALLGIIIGGGILFVIGFVYEKINKREGMGGGDVKLLAMIGGFFGWKSLLFVILAGSFAGALVGVTAMIIKKQNMKYAVPFGPFLAAAAIACIFWGYKFIDLLFIHN